MIFCKILFNYVVLSNSYVQLWIRGQVVDKMKIINNGGGG